MTRVMHNDKPHRVTKPFFTFGTLTLLIIMGVGFSFGITRMLLGLGTVTNLDNYNPWGIWISFDVACGVALAAGGFTTAALVDIFGRRKFKALLRPAILTAFLGLPVGSHRFELRSGPLLEHMASDLQLAG